ncbi:hypothetical protein AMJ40_06765, partial [candidate division TA06 bacterium DG_26]
SQRQCQENRACLSSQFRNVPFLAQCQWKFLSRSGAIGSDGTQLIKGEALEDIAMVRIGHLWSPYPDAWDTVR